MGKALCRVASQATAMAVQWAIDGAGWIDVFACRRKIKDTNGAPIGSLALAHAATPVQ